MNLCQQWQFLRDTPAENRIEQNPALFLGNQRLTYFFSLTAQTINNNIQTHTHLHTHIAQKPGSDCCMDKIPDPSQQYCMSNFVTSSLQFSVKNGLQLSFDAVLI